QAVRSAPTSQPKRDCMLLLPLLPADSWPGGLRDFAVFWPKGSSATQHTKPEQPLVDDAQVWHHLCIACPGRTRGTRVQAWLRARGRAQHRALHDGEHAMADVP